MLRVFITVDVEIASHHFPDFDPRIHDTVSDQFKFFRVVFDKYIYGVTPKGNFGLPFQLDLANSYGLKLICFVESLFSNAVGKDYLENVVDMIIRSRQEVQLHLHTEWLSKMSEPVTIRKTIKNLHNFSENEQVLLIENALDNLKNCGVKNICAFRAGNFGANLETLRALKRHRILYDSSYNYSYTDSTCRISTVRSLYQPEKINGIYEFPVSCFQDRPGHFRHLQICACSFTEMANMLMQAWRRGWYAVVIVSHSFELLNRKKNRPNPILVNRFKKLCQFLSDNSDKFRTSWFSEVVRDEWLVRNPMIS